MPIEVKMGEFSVGGQAVPGGWTAKIPSMTIDARDAEVYIGWITGKLRHEAEAQFLDACRDMWVAAWLKRLRERIAELAGHYRAINPDLGLAGFKPAELQGAYVPGARHGHARSITPVVRRLLVEMGQRQRALIEHERGGENGDLERS